MAVLEIVLVVALLTAIGRNSLWLKLEVAPDAENLQLIIIYWYTTAGTDPGYLRGRPHLKGGLVACPLRFFFAFL